MKLLHKIHNHVRRNAKKNIKIGEPVAVVKKEDQDTGLLTDGIVRDILTNSATHPHGIKVRLMSREVGRVKEIY